MRESIGHIFFGILLLIIVGVAGFALGQKNGNSVGHHDAIATAQDAEQQKGYLEAARAESARTQSMISMVASIHASIKTLRARLSAAESLNTKLLSGCSYPPPPSRLEFRPETNVRYFTGDGLCPSDYDPNIKGTFVVGETCADKSYQYAIVGRRVDSLLINGHEIEVPEAARNPGR